MRHLSGLNRRYQASNLQEPGGDFDFEQCSREADGNDCDGQSWRWWRDGNSKGKDKDNDADEIHYLNTRSHGEKDNNADDKNLDEVIVGLLEIRVAVCSIWRAVMIMVIIIMAMII